VGGVQHQQPHATEHALMYSIDYGIVDAGVGRVSPPGENVGRAQDLLTQAMLWLILSGCHDRSGITEQFGHSGGDGAVHAIWVALGHAGAISFGLFVKVFAPYSDADR
jgi:hypothetical protein